MRILLVDDDSKVVQALSEALTHRGYDVTEASGGEEAWKLYYRENFPVIITDLEMPGGHGLQLLKNINSNGNLPAAVIVMSGITDANTVEETFKAGAFDFLSKPVSMEYLFDVVKRACESVQSSSAKGEETDWMSDELIASIEKKHDLVIASEYLRNIVKQALNFHSASSVPVLIQGETGTGKEKIAQLVHDGLDKGGGPFIDVNCAAIPKQLLESELFGYESGAFTGADKEGKAGKFELADGGSLFLDEIGEMPLELQAKLLRIVEQGEVCRLGGSCNRSIKPRLICATNCDLLELVRQGKFRSDLFHRLNLGYIHLKPLRKQPQTIPPLVRYFLNSIARTQNKPFNDIAPDVIEKMQDYQWPGNIRELRNTIERTVLLHSDTVLRTEHLEWMPAATPVNSTSSSTAEGAINPGSLVLPSEGFDLEKLNDEIILKALRLHGGNKSHTAQYLGITRSKLLTRLKHIQENSTVEIAVDQL